MCGLMQGASDELLLLEFAGSDLEYLEYVGSGSNATADIVWVEPLQTTAVLKSTICKSREQGVNYEEVVKEAKKLLVHPHPNIAECYGLCRDKKGFLMEYGPSGTLWDQWMGWKTTLGTIHRSAVIGWAVQLLAALNYLHKNRIQHGDVKLDNVFFVGNVLKLTDFGCLASEGTEALSAGNGNYADGEGKFVRSAATGTDVFSFGLIFLQLLTFECIETIQAKRKKTPDEFRPKLHAIDRDCYNTIFSCFSPRERRISSRELLDYFEGLDRQAGSRSVFGSGYAQLPEQKMQLFSCRKCSNSYKVYQPYESLLRFCHTLHGGYCQQCIPEEDKKRMLWLRFFYPHKNPQ